LPDEDFPENSTSGAPHKKRQAALGALTVEFKGWRILCNQLRQTNMVNLKNCTPKDRTGSQSLETTCYAFCSDINQLWR